MFRCTAQAKRIRSSHNVADEQQRKFDNTKGEQESEMDEYMEWADDWYGTVILYY